MTVLGILGGCGVYDIAGLKNAAWRRVASPFGETSDELLFGVLDGLRRACSCRATAAATATPTSINYRANIDALKRVGRHRHPVALGLRLAARGAAAGAFRGRRPVHRPHLRPREELLRRRAASRMSRWRIRSARGSAMRVDDCGAAAGLPVTRGGTYLVMEGPQFSHPGRESKLYRSAGAAT